MARFLPRGRSTKRCASFSAQLLGAGAVISFFACAAPARADPEVDPYALSPEQLFGATVISASRTPLNVWEAPAAVYVITNSDIERSGATSIPEALRLAPGVEVARIDASGWAISVRGFNSPLANKLLILIDGREVYDPLFSGVYWDVQDTVLEDVDRIEIIRGPGASLWGANAVNGVINIITKEAVETQGLTLSAGAGDQDRAVVSARFGGEAGPNAHWRMYGRYFDRGAEQTLSGGDPHDAWQAWRGGFRFDSALGARDALTLQGDAYRSKSGQLRSIPQFTTPYAVVQPEDITATGGNVLARWTHQFSNDARLITQTYLDRTDREQATLKDSRTTFDVDTQYAFPRFAAHSVIAGLRYRLTNDVVTQTPIIASEHHTHREQLVSIFAQDQIALTPDHWRLTLGSKFDSDEYTNFEIQPSVRLQWMDGQRQMAWTAVSRAVRTPSELEREFNVVTGVIPPGTFPVPVSVELRPNADFDSEELTAYEIGYRRQWTPSLLMDLTAFHNDYRGISALVLQAPEIVVTPLHAVLPILASNSTDGETNGFEAVLSWRAADNLNISASYSLLDIELHGPPSTIAIASEASEDQSPRNQANLRFQWDPTNRLALDAMLFYVDELPGYSVDAYTRFDLRVGWRLTEHLEFDLVGQNLFDDAHREFGAATDANAAEIQRSVFGRLQWRS